MMAEDFTSLASIEAAARARMAPEDWAYLSAGDGPNTEAWRKVSLRPRILGGVTSIDTATTVLGAKLAAPILIAPNGRATRYHPEGEAALLAAAVPEGVGVVLASSVSDSLGALRKLAPNALMWSQLYMARDRDFMRDRVDAAKAAGCRALVLTVDLVPGARSATPPPRASWEAPSNASAEPLYAAASLNDLAWLCELGELPVAVKGVLRADDALACIDSGAAGIVVSNHGGNQLEDAIATADALPEIANACKGRAEIYVDGGIRSGASIVKALARGARAVMVGRPFSHGLAVNGAKGASTVLSLLKSDLARTMALCGASNLAAITPDLLAR